MVQHIFACQLSYRIQKAGGADSTPIKRVIILKRNAPQYDTSHAMGHLILNCVRYEQHYSTQ